MVYFLVASVLLNILILVVASVLVYMLVTTQTEAEFNRLQWERWETEWHTGNALLREEHKLHISPSGLRTKTIIKIIP